MRVYHGTTESHALRAIEEGLKPPRDTQLSNWDCAANPDAVYLSTTYPIYFATVAMDRLKKAGQGHERIAVLEIETDMLDSSLLVPDEDLLEQSGRNRDHLDPGLSMEERTEWYRDNIERWAHSDLWRESLKYMGTCGYLDGISPEAITRVAYVDILADDHKALLMNTYDVTVTIENHSVMAGSNAAFVNWLFEGELPELEPFHEFAMKRTRGFLDHSSVEVVDLAELRRRAVPSPTG